MGCISIFWEFVNYIVIWYRLYIIGVKCGFYIDFFILLVLLLYDRVYCIRIGIIVYFRG